jgi:hypothetical protein
MSTAKPAMSSGYFLLANQSSVNPTTCFLDEMSPLEEMTLTSSTMGELMLCDPMKPTGKTETF